MKRNKFIVSLFGSMAIPFGSFSQLKRSLFRNDKGFKVKAGEGRIHGHIEMQVALTSIVDVKISGKDTDGDLAIFEQTAVLPGRGWPRHVHHSQDKTFYVTEGEYLFKLGDDKYRLNAGDSIYLPRKSPHAWIQLSETGKANITMQPAGKLEAFFVAIASLTHDPTPAEMHKIFTDHEMEIVGPGLRAEDAEN
ncbi:cupin domain-containing protein [Flavitalea sp.]|nr:cupin domain-containing protein [Flavitalea sp.]